MLFPCSYISNTSYHSAGEQEQKAAAVKICHNFLLNFQAN